MNNPINLFQQFLSLGNTPQSVEQALFQQNPQLQVIAYQMKQSGLPPMEFVMQYARQQNIQPEVIQNMYQQMLGMIRY